MPPKLIEPDEPVPIRLSAAQRDLILEETLVGGPLEKLIRDAEVAGSSIVARLTLDDLDELTGHVAAQANHATNSGSRNRDRGRLRDPPLGAAARLPSAMDERLPNHAAD